MGKRGACSPKCCWWLCVEHAVTLSHWHPPEPIKGRYDVGLDEHRVYLEDAYGGNERHTTRGKERFGAGRDANVTVDGFNAVHWTAFCSFLIQPIFRANLPQLSSLTKLFLASPSQPRGSLPLSLLLLTDPVQISYCTRLTWHALPFLLISPHCWFLFPLPFRIHNKQA